jgi:hypothetical protein
LPLHGGDLEEDILALATQLRGLAAAGLVHGLVEVGDDVELIQHVLRTTGGPDGSTVALASATRVIPTNSPGYTVGSSMMKQM